MEVLSHVLFFAIPRPGYQDQFVPKMTNKPQATLSLVCRYWQQAIIKTPQIWSYIHLSEETTEQTLRRRIELSSREPLDIRVDVGDDEDSSDTLSDLYDSLLTTVDRWRSFVFQGTVEYSARRWIPHLLPNVVEAAYYGLIEYENEGMELFNSESGEVEVYRFKPWTVSPKLRRFAVETAGQFYFMECPLVTEFSLSEMKPWWGGISDTHSWHDKWEEFFDELTEMCPQLETLEIRNSWYSRGVDPMGWTKTATQWPQFAHLHTLKLDAVNSASVIPIISKLDAPQLRDLHLGHIHICLPLPLPSVTLSIDPSACRVHFDKSPLHAIKLFLEGVSQVQELNLSIELADALGVGVGVETSGKFTDERGDDLKGEHERIKEDWTWITKHTRSVQWILPHYASRLFSRDGELKLETAVLIGMLGNLMDLGMV
ncbi:hypothetical protein FRC01_007882 [Tulasnella sp. 417]|nr:hypothetical protein FRC01_007882 [Tulasnella sp. 417]